MDKEPKANSEGSVKSRTLFPGECLFREGEWSNAVYIITSGKLRVFKAGPEGRVHLADLGEKQVVGEMALLAHRPRSATVEAAQETVVLELDGNKLQTYFESQPAWFKALIESLVMRIRSSNERMEKVVRAAEKA